MPEPRNLRFPLLIAAIASLLTLPALGAPRKCMETEGKVHQTAGLTYSDFHVIITSDTNIDVTFSKLTDDGAVFDSPTISGEGTQTVQINWTGLNVPANDGIGIGIEFTLEEYNTYRITKQWTTGNRIAGGTFVDTPALGLSVTNFGLYSLTNEYQQGIDFANLQYIIQDDPLGMTNDGLTELMEQIAEGSPFDPGWTPLPDGSVAPQSSTSVAELDIFVGENLWAFFQEDFAAGSSDTSFTIQMHEHQASFSPDIPTISGIGLFAMLAVFLAAGLILSRKFRSRPAAEQVPSTEIGVRGRDDD